MGHQGQPVQDLGAVVVSVAVGDVHGPRQVGADLEEGDVRHPAHGGGAVGAGPLPQPVGLGGANEPGRPPHHRVAGVLDVEDAAVAPGGVPDEGLHLVAVLGEADRQPRRVGGIHLPGPRVPAGHEIAPQPRGVGRPHPQDAVDAAQDVGQVGEGGLARHDPEGLPVQQQFRTVVLRQGPPPGDDGPHQLPARGARPVGVGDELDARGQVGVLGRGNSRVAVVEDLQGQGRDRVHPAGPGGGGDHDGGAGGRPGALQLIDHQGGALGVGVGALEPGVDADRLDGGARGDLLQALGAQAAPHEALAVGAQGLPRHQRARRPRALGGRGPFDVGGIGVVAHGEGRLRTADDQARDGLVDQGEDQHDHDDPGRHRAHRQRQALGEAVAQPGLQVQQAAADRDQQHPQPEADGEDQEVLRRRVGPGVRQGGDLLLPADRAQQDPVERQDHRQAQGDFHAPPPPRPPPGQAPTAGLPQDPDHLADPGAPVPGDPDPQQVAGSRAQPAGRPLEEQVAGEQRGGQGQDEEHGAQDEPGRVGAKAVPEARDEQRSGRGRRCRKLHGSRSSGVGG